MLGQRSRRWPNIKTTLSIFSGSSSSTGHAGPTLGKNIGPNAGLMLAQPGADPGIEKGGAQWLRGLAPKTFLANLGDF